MLPEAQIMKKKSEIHSNICDRMPQVTFFFSETLTYIFDFKCLNSIVFMLSVAKIMKKNQQQSLAAS